MASATNASFAEAARVAFRSLRASKLRSFLTLLGIILATTTLIAVMSVIRGMDDYIANTVADMGVDGFRVRRMVMIGQWDPKKFLEMQRKNPQLTREEFAFVKRESKLLREVGMEISRQGVTTYGSERVDGIELRGVSSNVGVITNTQIAQGRFLTESDDSRHTLSAVIGHEIKERFFPAVDPIGKTIQVSGRPFTVVGVAKEQGSVFGQSRDRFVIIPAETYFKMFGSRTGIGYAGGGRQFRDLLVGFAGGGVGPDDGGDRGDGGGDCERVHGGGRGGDYEHHACGGVGTDARDRDPEERGGAAAGHFESVSGGVVGVVGDGRAGGRGDCVGGGGVGAEYDVGADDGAVERGDDLGGIVDDGGVVLWYLPGATGVDVRPD
jgi:hypothetical protein